MFSGSRTASRSFSDWAIGRSLPPPRLPPPPVAHQDIRKLLESIVCNVDRLALDAATVMSGINTLHHPEMAMKAVDIARYLPVQDHHLPSMLLALSEMTGVPCALPESEPLLRAFRDGADVMAAFIDDEEQLGSARARIIHAERLKIIWQGVCCSARQLVSETTSEMRLMLPLAYRQNSAVLSSLLSGAMNGLSPCLNEKGQLYAPNLPQQRRWPRHTILQNCRVEFDGETFEAFVQDASAGGLGLEKMPEVPRNSPLKVTLESGRTFDCIVAWSDGSCAGVKFPAPLSQSDPLLTG